jgi:hypothetical protein
VEEWQHLEADDELKEVQRENKAEESETAVTSSSESYGEPPSMKPHAEDLVPFYFKTKAVTLAQLHTIWSVR